MLSAWAFHGRRLRRMRTLHDLKEAVEQGNMRKRGVLREHDRIDLNLLEEEEWQNLFQ